MFASPDSPLRPDQDEKENTKPTKVCSMYTHFIVVDVYMYVQLHVLYTSIILAVLPYFY